MSLLKYVLIANSLSCLLFGCLFVVSPEAVVYFLSQSNPVPQWTITALGVGLIINGLHLIWAASRQISVKQEIAYFIVGDYLWVFGSIILLVSGIGITSTKGVITTIFVAIMVLTFAIMQQYALKRSSLKDVAG